MSDSDKTTHDSMIKRLLNIPFIAFIVIAAAAFIGLGDVFDAQRSIFKTEEKLQTSSAQVDQNEDGSATLVFKLYTPPNTNADWLRLNFERVGPVVDASGSDSTMIKAVEYDISISEDLIDSDKPVIEKELRLIKSDNEPYALAEVTLWWDTIDTKVKLKVVPDFLDNQKKSLNLPLNAKLLTVELVNKNSVEAKSRG